jgi:hypothetical protein
MIASRLLRLSSVCLAALLAAACSGSSDSGDDPGGSDDGSTGDTGNPGDGDTGSGGDGSFRIDWGPRMVEPGVEDTQCVVKRLPNDRPIKIGEIHNELGAASHHLIVYRVNEGEEIPDPQPCRPFADVLDLSGGAPLAVTQKADEVIALPAGVGMSLEPGQLIRVELHFINATDQPQELRASSTFMELPEEEFQQEADFMFVGNPDIVIDPQSAFTLGPSFLPLPDDLAGINIFAITGHEHQWGTNVQVNLASSPDDEGTSIYAPENFSWDEPETVYHDPAVNIPAGSGFRFTCDWMNLSDETVEFGESVDNEMCFFWAYYYPSHGSRMCFHTDRVSGGANLCCPGADFCDNLGGFLDP